eukprot:753571-Hanusia_phi.AAC.4
MQNQRRQWNHGMFIENAFGIFPVSGKPPRAAGGQMSRTISEKSGRGDRFSNFLVSYMWAEEFCVPISKRQRTQTLLFFCPLRRRILDRETSCLCHLRAGSQTSNLAIKF